MASARWTEAQRARPLLREGGDLLVRDQLDAAVLGPSLTRLVGGDEVRLPIAMLTQSAFCHTMIRHVLNERRLKNGRRSRADWPESRRRHHRQARVFFTHRSCLPRRAAQ